MDELIICYKKAKSAQIAAIVVGGYFAAFCLYLVVEQLMHKTFAAPFYFALIGCILGILVILSNTLWTAKPLVKINNTIFDVRNVNTIEWTNVSQVGIGTSYFVFLLNGQKEVKVDLSMLVYTDLVKVKSKIVELCEFKNIPYKNQ